MRLSKIRECFIMFIKTKIILLLALYLLINIISVDGRGRSGGRSHSGSSHSGRSWGFSFGRSSSHSSGSSHGSSSSHSSGLSSYSPQYESSHSSGFGSSGFGLLYSGSHTSSYGSTHSNPHSQIPTAPKKNEPNNFGGLGGFWRSSPSFHTSSHNYIHNSIPQTSSYDSSTFQNSNLPSSVHDDDFGTSKQETSTDDHNVQSTTEINQHKQNCSSNSGMDQDYYKKLIDILNTNGDVRYQDLFAHLMRDDEPCQPVSTEPNIDPTSLISEISTNTEADAVVQFLKNKHKSSSHEGSENDLNAASNLNGLITSNAAHAPTDDSNEPSASTLSAIDLGNSFVPEPQVSTTTDDNFILESQKTSMVSPIEHTVPESPLIQVEYWQMPGESIIYDQTSSNQVMLAQNSNIHIASSSKSLHLKIFSLFGIMFLIMAYSFHW